MLSFFPRGVLDEILNLIESISEDFPSYSLTVCLYKGNGDALDRGNYCGLKLTEQVMKILYCGLKLTEQVMKVLERIVDGLIRRMVSIDDSKFGFVPGRSTTDAIFVARQLQEKYRAANLRRHLTKCPRKVIWWALRSLRVEERIVLLVQGIYSNARSRVRDGEGYSEEFEVKVGVHQGSVISLLLFITVLEALTREFRCGVP